MAGSKIGGMKAAAKNKAKHGEDFYKVIGAKGGRNGNTGGFATKTDCDCDTYAGTHTKAMCAGVKGGRRSRRGPTKPAPELIKASLKDRLFGKRHADS